jgi:hypothetical protein
MHTSQANLGCFVAHFQILLVTAESGSAGIAVTGVHLQVAKNRRNG